MNSSNCFIISVGKRRDGGTRYWCIEHKADATAKYGRRARRCRYADEPTIKPDEILELVPEQYPGGIALWGAVPPVYDTTSLPYDRGVHVHARKVVGGKKEIDETYRTIILVDDVPGRTRTNFAISELDAIYYMTSSVFGRTMRYVECTLCGYPHLDRDWFSLHAHRRHLCAACGRQFRDIEIGIGNPLIRISEIFGFNRHKIKKARKRIQINQAKYPGGIQIWGSNPAFLWTDSSRSEEEGIHIHIVSDNGSDVEVDETYAQVEIDGERLDPGMVRVLMAQMALPHISGRVIDIRCPKCGEAHFDGGDLAVIPHEIHTCDHCGFKFRSKGRLRKTIGNPILGTLSRLSETAIRAPQERPVYLIPETL